MRCSFSCAQGFVQLSTFLYSPQSDGISEDRGRAVDINATFHSTDREALQEEEGGAISVQTMDSEPQKVCAEQASRLTLFLLAFFFSEVEEERGRGREEFLTNSIIFFSF